MGRLTDEIYVLLCIISVSWIASLKFKDIYDLVNTLELHKMYKEAP